MPVLKTKVRITNTNTGVYNDYVLDGEVAAFPVDGLTPLTTYTATAYATINNISWTTSNNTVTFTTPEYTAYPASLDEGYAMYNVSNINNAFTAYDSSTYASFNFTKGANAESYAFLSFNANIPANAVIDSVSITARCNCTVSNASYIQSRQIQPYAGNTPKGTAKTVLNTGDIDRYTYTWDDITWTAAELNNAKIRLYSQRASENVNNGYYYRFYGATLTVVWH